MKKFNKDKTIKVLKAIGGLIALPIVFGLFTLDRLILVGLPHIKHGTFMDVLRDLKLLNATMYRVIGVSALYGVYSLLKWIF